MTVLVSMGVSYLLLCNFWSVWFFALCVTIVFFFFFFFKQKTAYEMCGRDWSSDVCSSDLSVLNVTIYSTPVLLIPAYRERVCLRHTSADPVDHLHHFLHYFPLIISTMVFYRMTRKTTMTGKTGSNTPR